VRSPFLTPLETIVNYCSIDNILKEEITPMISRTKEIEFHCSMETALLLKQSSRKWRHGIECEINRLLSN